LTLTLKRSGAGAGAWAATSSYDYIATNEISSLAMSVLGDVPIFTHSSPPNGDYHRIYTFKYYSSYNGWSGGLDPIIEYDTIYNLTTAVDSSGTIYVAYKKKVENNYDVYVQKYVNGINSAVQVGSNYVAHTTTTFDKISMAVNNAGQIFLAFLTSEIALKVYKYTTSWSDISEGIFYGGGSTYGNYLDLELDSRGSAYLSYKDSSNYNKATVKKNTNGNEWTTIGTGICSSTGGYTEFLDLEICGDTIFLAFADGLSSLYKPNVMTYNGSIWVRVGGTEAYSAEAASMSLAVYNNRPYIAFKDASVLYAATVRCFNGTSWETLGTAGITNSNLELQPALVVNSAGIPFFGYKNSSSLNRGNVKKYIIGE